MMIPPCAIFTILSTPNTNVYPMAMTAYTLPRVKPLTNCWKNTIHAAFLLRRPFAVSTTLTFVLLPKIYLKERKKRPCAAFYLLHRGENSRYHPFLSLHRYMIIKLQSGYNHRWEGIKVIPVYTIHRLAANNQFNPFCPVLSYVQ